MISVAIATYNGEKYIEDQLTSIINQSITPDEIIISDDNSSDRTVFIINEYLKEKNINYHINQNKKNLGFNKNFEIALEKCSGDLIFICDQDDSWNANKIENILEDFKLNPHIKLVIHDLRYCNESLVDLGYSKIERMEKFYNIERSYVTGMATTVKKDFLSFCLPIPKGVNYDLWLHTCAYYLGVKHINKQSLSLYRRHNSNATKNEHLNSTIQNIFFYFLNIIKVEKENKTDEIKNIPKIFLGFLYKKKNRLKKSLKKNKTEIQKIIQVAQKDEYAFKMREKIVYKNIFLRIIFAFYFYFTGGYNRFSGIKSLVKDIIIKRK